MFIKRLFLCLLLLSAFDLPVALAQEPAAAPAEATATDAVAPEATPLAAETPENLIARLPQAGFGEKGEIAAALAASGFPRTVIVLDALSAGTLYAQMDGPVVIGPAEGQTEFTNAFSGAPIPGLTEDSLEKITVNNRLRRELRGLAASLSLKSPDLAVRRAAAESAFMAADPDALAAIDDALGQEEDATVRRKLEEAKAAITLKDAAASDELKIGAIQKLSARGDQPALNALLAFQPENPDLRTRVDAAVGGVRSSLAYWGALQNVYYGVSLGSVLLLAAIGLAITFGVMGIINMAHGEMIMIGAYATFVVQQVVSASAPGLAEYSLLLAIPVAFVVAGGIGIGIERSVIRFLYGRPLETLLATWGISLVLQQAVRSIFGPTNRPVVTPDFMSGAFEIGHLTITYTRLWVIIFAMIVMVLLMLFLKRTHFGMQMRAVTQNRQMASAMGIRTDWVDALTFGLGSGIAGIAGVALSQLDNVSPNLGQSYIIDSFMVVVFGGVGNIWGTLVGALSLGIANKFLEPYAGAVLGKILVLALIILFIQRRPRGLFALKGRAVEA